MAVGAELQYRRDIDGLRAFAIIPVVLFHAGLGALGGGFVGVDVFFVISGFLITSTLLQDHSILRFYERRLRRILPALIVVLVACTLCALVILLPSDLVAYTKSQLSALLFSSNIYFWRQSGYFAPITEIWPLLHTWSLGVEEQFYIFFPICVGIFAKFRRVYFMAFILLAIIVSYYICTVLMKNGKMEIAFYLMPGRAWELLAGSLLALGVIPKRAHPHLRAAVALLGILLICWAVVTYSSQTVFPGVTTIPPVLGAALVIWAGMDGEHPLTKFIGAEPLRFVGLISYSLYLWHWPILAFMRYVNVDHISQFQAVFAVAASMLAAWVSWRYVERPFRKLRSQRQIWLMSGAAMAMMIVVSLALMLLQGVPGRFSRPIVVLNADQGDTWRCPPYKFVSFGSYYACPVALPSHDPGKADVVIWGDSHAQMYVPALERALGGRGALLVNVYSCAPALGNSDVAACGPLQRANFAAIVRLPAHTVILAQNWAQYRNEAGKIAGRATLPEERFQPAVQRLWETVAALKKAGKRVLIVSVIPNPEYELPSVVSRDWAFFGRTRHVMLLPEAKFTADYQNVLNAEKRLSQVEGVKIINVRQKICMDGSCRYIQGQHSVFADHGHLRTEFSESLGDIFKQAL